MKVARWLSCGWREQITTTVLSKQDTCCLYSLRSLKKRKHESYQSLLRKIYCAHVGELVTSFWNVRFFDVYLLSIANCQIHWWPLTRYILRTGWTRKQRGLLFEQYMLGSIKLITSCLRRPERGMLRVSIGFPDAPYMRFDSCVVSLSKMTSWQIWVCLEDFCYLLFFSFLYLSIDRYIYI